MSNIRKTGLNTTGFKLTNLEEDPKIVRDLVERSENALLYKLIDVKKDVFPLLDQIKITFPEFTSHDVAHSERVLEKLDLLIPDALMREMNQYEIYFLIASAYLHDTGMAVFPNFKELELFKFDDEMDKQTEGQKEKTRNFIRDKHHERSEEICKRIFSVLLGDEHQAGIIGRICRGHRKDNLRDISLYNSKQIYRNKSINVPLLASLLRNGDELDLTFERIPWIMNEYVPPKNPISKEEWNKHLAIGGVSLDPEDHLTIRCSAICKNPRIHISLENLEIKIESELKLLPTHLNHYRKFISFVPRTFIIDIVPVGYSEKLDTEEDYPAVETPYDGITKTGCISIFTQGTRPEIDPKKVFGRESDLEIIEDLLKDKCLLVITGFRGTGKSTLASMFVDKMEKTGKFAGIFWQKMDETTDISDVIGNFFTAIGKPKKDLSSFKITDQLTLLFKELNEASYLLVLDNFEVLLDPQTNKPLESKIVFSDLIKIANEKCKKSKILITSWESLVNEHGIKPTSYQIKGLDALAGILLLRQEGLNESVTELKKAVELSNGHPLALILLAKLVRNGADSLSTLLYDNSLWIGKDGEVADNILNKVYNERLSEDERKVLQFMSIFRQPVPAKAIVAIASDPGWTELKVKRIALSLIYKSLLQKDAEGYWEESLICNYASASLPEKSKHHKLTCNYYLSLPLTNKPLKKEDVQFLIEAHYHACMAKEYDQAFKIMFDYNLHENLLLWGNYTVLVDLCSLMLPEDHFGNEILIENKGNHSEILGYLGYAYYNLCESRKAIEYYEPALRIAKEIRDRKLEGLWLGKLGNVYRRLLNDHERAIVYLEQALKIAREVGDRKSEGNWLGGLGSVYKESYEFRKAIVYLEQALKIAREVGDRKSEGDWLGVLGQIYRNQGESRKAIEHFEQAIKIAREMGHKNSEGVWIGNLGIAIHFLGEPKRAIVHYEQSNKIAKEVGDRSLEGINLENMGISYSVLGETRKAIDNYEQAIKISKEIGDRRVEGNTLLNLGKAYNDLGDFIKAIEYLEQALKIAKEIGDKSLEGQFLGNLWDVYRDQGESKKAIEYFEQELKFAREKEEKRSEEILLENLGLAYKDLCEYKKAIDYLKQALKIAQEIENRIMERLLLSYLGQAYLDLGEHRKAIEYYEQALKIVREIEDRSSEEHCLENLGYAHHVLREYEKAIEYHEQALSIGKEIEDPKMISYNEDELKKLRYWKK